LLTDTTAIRFRPEDDVYKEHPATTEDVVVCLKDLKVRSSTQWQGRKGTDRREDEEKLIPLRAPLLFRRQINFWKTHRKPVRGADEDLPARGCLILSTHSHSHRINFV
jgi:hypothetical protein